MLQRVRFPAFASAVLCVASLAACGSVPSAAAKPAPAGWAGYDWRVVAVGHDRKVTTIPARLGVDLRFSLNGRFAADDPVNTHSGSFRITRAGFTTSNVGSTLAGYAGHDPLVLLTQRALSAFGDGTHATAALTGDRLLITVASYTLTCQRHGPAGSNV